jgi:hypothetical protein
MHAVVRLLPNDQSGDDGSHLFPTVAVFVAVLGWNWLLRLLLLMVEEDTKTISKPIHFSHEGGNGLIVLPTGISSFWLAVQIFFLMKKNTTQDKFVEVQISIIFWLML